MEFDPLPTSGSEPLDGYFPRNAYRKFQPETPASPSSEAPCPLRESPSETGATIVEPSSVVVPRDNSVASEPIPEPEATSRQRRGRPARAKRGRPPLPKPDGRTRTWSPVITQKEYVDLRDAQLYARALDRPLTVAVTIHPKRLATYPVSHPDKIGNWFRSKPIRALSEWFKDRKRPDGSPVGWYAIGTREVI